MVRAVKQTITRIRRIRWYAWVAITLILVAGLVSVLGTVGIPWLVRNPGAALLQDALGREVRIQKVRFDPGSLRLRVLGLQVMEPEGRGELLGVQQLDIDLQLSSLFQQTVNLESVVATGVRLTAVHKGQGRYNFSDILARLSKQNNENVNDSGPTVRGRLARLLITKGEIDITDKGVRNELQRIVRFSVAATDISTEPGSNAEFTVSLGAQDENMNLQGGLAFSPLRAKGRASIERIDATAYSPYFAPHLALTLSSAVVQGSFDFDIDSSGERLNVSLADIALGLDNVTVRDASGRELLALPQARLTGGTASLAESHAEFERLELTKGMVSLQRDEDGTITILQKGPTDGNAADGQARTPPSEPGGDSQEVFTEAAAMEETLIEDALLVLEDAPFTAAVGEVVLKGWGVRFTDNHLPKPVTLETTDLDLRLGKLSTKLDTELPITLSGRFNSGSYRFEGQVSRGQKASINAHGQFNLEEIPLAILASYAAPRSPLNASEGTAGAHGSWRMEVPAGAAPLVADVEATISVSDARILDARGLDLATVHQAELNQVRLTLPAGTLAVEEAVVLDTVLLDGGTVADLDRLVIQGIDYAMQERDLRMRSMRLLAPTATLELTPSGLNLGRLTDRLKLENTGLNTDEGSNSNTDNQDQTKPLRVSADRILLERGQASLHDQTVTPPFSTTLEDIRLEVRNASTEPGSRMTVDLDAKVDKVSSLRVDGSLGPLQEGLFAELTLSLERLELPMLSPYTCKYLGYTMDNGKVSVNSDIRIQGSTLNAANHFQVEALRLGERIQAPDSTKVVNAPIELGLALLQDGNGDMSLDVHMDGDLNNPQFGFGSVISKAMAGAFTNIVSAPFSLLGALIPDFGPTELDHLVFAQGSAELTSSSRSRLDSLAKVLEKRPRLTLILHPRVDKDTEADELLQQAFLDTLRREKYQDLRDRGRTPESPTEVALGLEDVTEYLPRVHAKRVFSRSGRDPSLAVMEQEVKDLLSVSYAELRRLASTRASAVVDYLAEQHSIDPARIQTLPLVPEGMTSARVDLRLGSRK